MKDSKKTVADYLPPGAAGSLVLRALAASIEKANELAPDRWGLSRLARMLRLNLGMIEVMTVAPDEVRLLVAAECMPDHVPDADAMGLAVGSVDDLSVGFYKSVPGSAICVIQVPRCKHLRETLDALEQTHLTLLQRGALTSRNASTAWGHSVAGIREISSAIQRELPQPRYARSDTEPAHSR